MKVILIAAIGKNNEIGRENGLIWPIKHDLLNFKSVTRGKAVVMGSKTFESIGCKPLCDRFNIVLSRIKQRAHGVMFAQDIFTARNFAKRNGNDTLYVIGGAAVYKAFLPYADGLLLTEIKAEAKDATVFFPEFKDKFYKRYSVPYYDEKLKVHYSFTKWVPLNYDDTTEATLVV